MATNKNTLKNWFRTGLKPTQEQFWAWMDSYRHKDEKIPITAIDELEDILNAKAEVEGINGHLSDENAHTELFEAKENKTEKGQANGYVPLNEVVKIASDYLNIVNDLVTGGATSLASAETVKTLKTQIDGINVLLTSNDVNLDTVQELVNAIKTVQTSLSTILVNDLTTGGTTKAATAETVKTLKGLIDALTTTVGGKMSTLVTTVKTITSASLTTQDAAGFVAYVNALGAPLVVASNEIIEYQLSDTGRIFKLLLRGRSFGTGQPAITTADVEDCTLWMQKDLKLSNYPSTRNDGQLPSNRVLGTDASGNLKMYTIATAPAPYLEVLIPDSTLPSTTTNFTIKGAFFTPTMTVSIVGQTINYITFVSDNLVKVNVTTGSAEGFFAVTLNNGISATFPNALLIVLGTVFVPSTGDWESITGSIDLSEGNSARVLVKDTAGNANIKTTFFEVPATGFFCIQFNYKGSPLDSSPLSFGNTELISLVDSSTNAVKYKIYLSQINTGVAGKVYITASDVVTPSTAVVAAFNAGGNPSQANMVFLENYIFQIKRISGSIGFYVNGTLAFIPTLQYSSAMKIKLTLQELDVEHIKLILP